MKPEALRFPLFLGDPDQLKSKLERSRGLLRHYWEDFPKTFLANPQIRPQVIFLPAALTGEGLEEARTALQTYYRDLARGDTLNDVQFHTWCRCGSVMRRAAFFDWLAYRGAWSAAEIEEAAECFLGFGFKHAYPVLAARCRASNNQAISMALYLAVAGFLFGHKLANHPTGRFLFEYGTGRLPDLIGLFAGDGYGGEGSTYTSHVNTPLACWTSDFLGQVTGRNWLDTPFRPNGTTLRKMIEMELRLTSPGGLLAPWDHYGWQTAVNSSPYACLARVTGNPHYLSMIPAVTRWADPGYLAWGQDDPLWALLWWPDRFKDYDDRRLPEELFGWFLPKTGAALDDCPRRARLMQVWDFCAGSIAGIGRAQTNPNHLMFDYDGEPVFEDGVPEAGHDPWNYPADKVLAVLDPQARQRYLDYAFSIGAGVQDLPKLIAGLSPGLIGVANAIVIDEEPWYWPGATRVGKPQGYIKGPKLQAVTADCASFYRPHYDVTRARRTSVWSADGFGVVLDRLQARTQHTWRWQVYLRPDPKVEGNSARVKLTNGKQVLLAWEEPVEVRTTKVEGYPRTEEKRSCRLDLLKRGKQAEFAVVIAPEARSASIRRLRRDRVEVTIDGKPYRLSLAAIAGKRKPGRVRPDVHELSDIQTDRDLQSPVIEKLIRWAGEPVGPGATRLSQVDACLAQLPQAKPDLPALLEALRSPHWPVQLAAAEVLGRRRCREAIPALRQLLEAEHALPKEEIYPPEDAKPNGRSTEDLGKRWRLKTALITALGRLKDRQAVPLLGTILADGRDFYCVYSAAAQALGRIGGPKARQALGPALKDSEHNTQVRARFAQRVLSRAPGR